MCKVKHLLFVVLLAACTSTNKTATSTTDYNDEHRPQIHFSPISGWMNDPNGMVYFNNQYHLFYQYYPDSTVWGPMHWGHAVSKDLVRWQELPIALYPDSLGYIFSGSAVVDANNTSGFGQNGQTPLVAIFTHHDPKKANADRTDVETQSLAYSLDEGKTWTKYAGNPVIKNPGVRNFRDPKVIWFAAGKKWIMTLATADRVTFYSSTNLKDWTRESAFGKEAGAHGGVWECPDLFPLDYNGQKIWVLIVNINPGGPNGGSATQYFTGQFDGNKFTPHHTETRWLDYGPDEYAGITWSNTGDRKIFMGWMSNWQYANVVPTGRWRSATTVARDLGIEKVGDRFLVTSKPVPELNSLFATAMVDGNVTVTNYDFTKKAGKIAGPFKLQLSADKIESFSFTFSNRFGQNVVVGYDKASNHYYIDRTKSGKVKFEPGFAARHTAPRFSNNQNLELTLIVDNASIELFADGGLSVMTEIFFPHETFSNIQIQSPDQLVIKSLQLTRFTSIWK